VAGHCHVIAACHTCAVGSERLIRADVGKGKAMASVQDVAVYILQRTGKTSAMKLQKLVYYSQAWHLVWEERPLFPEKIEAWANGPVVRELYREHRKRFEVTARTFPEGNSDRLTETEQETIDAVVDSYGKLKAFELSEMTHREAPWKDARRGVPPGAACTNIITKQAMAEFYESLL
jgi:uncharacterized phage-associated protein